MEKFASMITPDLKDQMLKRGVYSNDPDVQRAAILEKQMADAAKGRTSSLNYCYARTKTGELSKERYAEIRKKYDEAVRG